MYQPKRLPWQIKALYLLKENHGKPMAHHAQAAVNSYLQQFPEILEQVQRLSDQQE